MGDLGDHASGRRRIDEFGYAPNLVELEPNQRFTLRMNPARRAAGLPELHGLARGLAGSFAFFISIHGLIPGLLRSSAALNPPRPVRHRPRGGAPAASRPSHSGARQPSAASPG